MGMLVPMKLSVSVPDELWARACAAAQSSSPSEVVQAGLRRFVALEDPSHWRPDSEAGLQAGAIADGLREEAEAHFRKGYETGLALAEEADWKLLDLAAVNDFDVRQVQRQLELDGATLVWNLEGLLEIYRSLGGGVLFERGVRAALRDVWRSVVEK